MSELLENTQALIQHHTGLTMLDLGRMRVEQGCCFAEMKERGDKQTIKKLHRDKLYWGWWNNQFDKRDKLFLATVDLTLSMKKLRALYLLMNDAEVLMAAPLDMPIHVSYSALPIKRNYGLVALKELVKAA